MFFDAFARFVRADQKSKHMPICDMNIATARLDSERTIFAVVMTLQMTAALVCASSSRFLCAQQVRILVSW